MRTNKNGFAPLVIILIIAILGVVGYFVYKNFVPTSGNFTKSLDILSKISSEISNTKGLDSHDLIISKTNDGDLFRTSPDGYLIDVGSSPQVSASYKCYTENVDSTEDSFTKVAPDLISRINDLLLANSFKAIGKGLDLKALDFGEYDYVNSVSGLYCQLAVDVGCSGSSQDAYHMLHIVCNNDSAYDQSYTSQIQELKDLGVKGATLNQVSNFGSFYVLDACPGVGACVNSLVQKTNKKWTMIDAGDGGFSCEKINKYKDPHQLKGAEQCYDSVSQKNIDNPN